MELVCPLHAGNPRGMPTTPLQARSGAFGECQSQPATWSRRSWEARPQGRVLLSEVGFDHIDDLIGRVRLLRIRFSLRVKYMVPDVAFQELSH